MTQPRRADEVALFAELRKRSADNPVRAHNGYIGGGRAMIALWDELAIPHNRGEYLLQKWTSKGWWDYGTWAKGGWFTREAPETLE